MRYAIGLDVGITSVGWSVLELNQEDEPFRIVKLGSRIFDAAENPKDGAALALPRREARGTRRRIRRHVHRKQRIKHLLINDGIITEAELGTLFSGQLDDIYYLRTKALDELLTKKEMVRVLIHLSQRRGFLSNRKSDQNDKEGGKLLGSISKNQDSLERNGYRTVGEMFYKDPRFVESKRNKTENYLNTVSRQMVLDEIITIFDSQRKLGNVLFSEDLQNKYVEIVMSQRHYADGPGGNSQYGGNLIEKMIGNCSFFPDEQRAPKASYSFQYFRLLQAVNNLAIVTPNYTTPLTEEQRSIIINQAHKSKAFNYTKIRKLLSISDDCRFNISYGYKELKEVEDKTKFEFLNQYHQVRSCIGDTILTLSTEEKNAIGYALTVYKTDDEIERYLSQAKIDNGIVQSLLFNSNFSGFGHISVKACDMLIPYLEQGHGYTEACALAGIKSVNSNSLNDITNPVVKRAVSQTLKVVKSIVREQGANPVYINIELAREMSKNYDERRDIENRQKENRAVNEKIKERLQSEFGVFNPTGLDIVKFKLWQEQGGICPYSQTAIEIERLFEKGYVQVDHIIPYSISFDDGYNNKVLVKTIENQHKGNHLPLQYMTESQAEKYKVWVENQYNRNFVKKKNLLKEKITDNDKNSFKERNLQDTKYISRFLLNYLKNNFEFEDFHSKKVIHVHAVNGVVTAYIRKRWGIEKIRSDGNLHHAVDASVIACVTPALIQRVSKHSKYNENRYALVNSYVVDQDTGEAEEKFPLPYPTFVKELEARISQHAKYDIQHMRLPNYTFDDIQSITPPFVSKMPNHKVTGPAHKETIKSQKSKGYSIKKVDLASLKIKNGEIQDYYNPESDKLLYNAIKQRLLDFDGNGQKAFPPGFKFYKPKSDGTAGPLVKKVKIEEKQTSGVLVRHKKGFADNGSMVRVDVFYVENEGYYLVPIYVADTVKPELPNKAIVAHKPYDEWKEMKEENFVFSLYPNDLIKVTAEKDMIFTVSQKDSSLPKQMNTNKVLLYYRGTNISTGSITVETHDSAYKIGGLGVKTIPSIEKYTVDVLGNYNQVKKEKRMKFH